MTMKLHYKAFVLVFVTVGLCTLLAMLGASWTVDASFRRMEETLAHREGDRATRLFGQQLKDLGALVRNSAYTIRMVDYAEGRDPGLLRRDFDATSMGGLDITHVLAIGHSGKPLGSVALDQTGAQIDAPSHLFQAVEALTRTVLTDEYGGVTLQTIVASGGQLYMVAGAAMLDPMKSNSASGVLVFLRHLSNARVHSLSHVLMRPVRVDHIQSRTDHGVALNVTDSETLELHVPLQDLEGQTLAHLVLDLDRPLMVGQQKLSASGQLLAGLAGLAASVLLLVVLYRFVLRRLKHLHADVLSITRNGPTANGDVRVEGHDELATLAQGVNLLLDRVRKDAVLQQEAHQRQEQLQQQLLQSQKTEALGRLTGGIAHDFNNSLAAITGWMRLATEDLEQDHPSADALRQALKATRYADGLMRQLLAFGRQTPPKLQCLHMSSLVEDTRHMVASGLTRDCELVVDFRVEDDRVYADPTQIQQVLVNLLINAADAMQGKGRIELTLHSLEIPIVGRRPPPGANDLPAGRYLTLSVCDQGPGVPTEHLGRVFDPFFTTKGKGRGTGLGLSVAHGIVLRHQGGIGVENRREAGACFFVHLPLCSVDEDLAPTCLPEGDQPSGKRVLFVDDDQLVRHAWSTLLERQGWQVTRARDGEEGWTLFQSGGGRFDLVLTDQSMPRLDGVGLARRIRETEASPPIILISGHVNEVGAGDLQTLFNAVLHKPVDMSDLGRVMEEVLSSGTSRY